MESKPQPKPIVTTSIDAELRDWFDAEAKRRRRTRAELLRFAAEEYREREVAKAAQGKAAA